MTDEQRGIAFPRTDGGGRSTSSVGRAVVADALRLVDEPGAAQAEREASWRSGYLVHFRRLVEAGLPNREAAVAIAGSGLASLRSRMVVVQDDEEVPLEEWATSSVPSHGLDTVEVAGDLDPDTEVSVPAHGVRLRGDDLREQLDAWVRCGAMEPSAADAVRTVMDHPEWLRLDGRTVAVLGAGAEMGPLQSLLRWGARVAAVDLPMPAVWERVLATPSAGTLLVPAQSSDEAPLARRAGADLVEDMPAVAHWLGSLGGSLVVGNYVYADGADNVRVSTAVDALSTRLTADLDDVSLAFLATPTDVFAVPAEAVAHATRSYEQRSRTARLVGRPLRTVSGGRLLQRPYVATADPGLADSLVPQQGPNYALAKRLQRWRATVARAEGTTVSMNVAPPTRTRSVVKNRALAAAYAGAHRFGVEIFEPATSNVLMAVLLVHDLQTGGGPTHDHPWQDEAFAAVHGGLWRAPYAPRSALGLAAVLGYGAARG